MELLGFGCCPSFRRLKVSGQSYSPVVKKIQEGQSLPKINGSRFLALFSSAKQAALISNPNRFDSNETILHGQLTCFIVEKLKGSLMDTLKREDCHQVVDNDNLESTKDRLTKIGVIHDNICNALDNKEFFLETLPNEFSSIRVHPDGILQDGYLITDSYRNLRFSDEISDQIFRGCQQLQNNRVEREREENYLAVFKNGIKGQEDFIIDWHIDWIDTDSYQTEVDRNYTCSFGTVGQDCSTHYLTCVPRINIDKLNDILKNSGLDDAKCSQFAEKICARFRDICDGYLNDAENQAEVANATKKTELGVLYRGLSNTFYHRSPYGGPRAHVFH